MSQCGEGINVGAALEAIDTLRTEYQNKLKTLVVRSSQYNVLASIVRELIENPLLWD